MYHIYFKVAASTEISLLEIIEMQRTVHYGKGSRLRTFFTVEKENIADFCMPGEELCI
jgi:hypothetical protein